ncbi:MAG: 50S ribosomal protein L18 [Candidatus Eisenbacteria bacterium]|nr:50S ribosomal protein L18 [Candidatus Eisenbacteria bacterium]MCC7141927.1 50S ribosomal protein L18 [Candidatus Eisenbacteria bacterium]
MKSIAEKRRRMRIRRHLRIRKKLAGTGEVPRLAVYRSSKHIYAQLVNDLSGVSLCGTSSLDPTIKEALKGLKKAEKSKAVGKRMAEIALEKGILKIAFDRGGYVYHGRIQALAEGAREGGLRF